MLRVDCMLFAAILLCACAAPITPVTEDKGMGAQSAADEIELPFEGDLPSLAGATGWLNSKPMTRDDLRGKVVLVQFWTFTCINWLRTEPYVRAWAEKYKDKGLVVIGVHTPEFEFEKDRENVRRMAKDQKVDYPIAIDTDYAIWYAFNNHYWPAIYIVDSKGRIRHHQFGEGEYERSEKIIQQLLAEAGNRSGAGLVSVKGEGLEAEADWKDLRTPENYVGYQRTENFASPEGVRRDQQQTYLLPTELSLNEWGLLGDWKVGMSSVTSSMPNGKIAYRFHARDLHLVLSTSTTGKPVRFRVTIDGKAPGDAHGGDVDAGGNGVITQPRLYQLIRQNAPIVDRQFEIEFLDPGVEIHAFTFG